MNSFQEIDPKLLDVVLPFNSGYPEEVARGDTIEAIKDACGDASREFPGSLWIEPKDWKEWARKNDENKTWAMNFVDRYTNQNPTHECTCHSLSRLFEAARNRQRGIIYPEGPKANFRYDDSALFDSVWVAPLSVYLEANPRQWGGAGIRQVMEIAVRRGFLPETIQPRDYGFKHALHGTTGRGGKNQASGPWVSLSRLPEGWQETAKKFRIEEVIFPESYEQAVCLVLHGYGVGVGRSGHAIPWMQWMASNGAMAYPDSYDLTRYDSESTVRRAWSGGFAVASVSAPDNWKEPAK